MLQFFLQQRSTTSLWKESWISQRKMKTFRRNRYDSGHIMEKIRKNVSRQKTHKVICNGAPSHFSTKTVWSVSFVFNYKLSSQQTCATKYYNITSHLLFVASVSRKKTQFNQCTIFQLRTMHHTMWFNATGTLRRQNNLTFDQGAHSPMGADILAIADDSVKISCYFVGWPRLLIYSFGICPFQLLP